MRVLHYIYGFNIGGAESFIYNMLSEIDIKKYNIDFMLQSNKINNSKLKELCEIKKAKIFFVEKFNKNPILSFKETIDVLKNNYDIIHIHSNALINIIPIICAKLCNIKIVLHSHSTKNNSGGFLGKALHCINRRIYIDKKIKRVSCGVEAGRWMFDKKDFVILNNAIDLNKYKYSEESRYKIRKQLNLNNELVIGHVGRFVEVKNHTFIVECFEYIVKENSNVRLVFVGDGELQKSIKEMCKEKNIDKYCYFVGNIENVEEYYSAFDCMLFPSLFEGLPFTMVEAQASGLNIVASTNVTKDVNVTGRVKYLSLNESIDVWKKNILIKCIYDKDREACFKIMNDSVFNIRKTVSEIEKIYNECIV